MSGSRRIGRLELSEEGIRSSKVADCYDRVCREYRREFVEFVAALSEHNAGNIDWWVSAPASRNEVLSGLFRDFMYLRLVQVLKRSGELPYVLAVYSSGLKTVLERLLAEEDTVPRRCRVEYGQPALARFRTRLRRILSPWRSLGRVVAEWVAVRAAAGAPARLFNSDEARLLIDTFAISEDPSMDRYYPGLDEFLDEDARNRVWFAPQFMGVSIPGLVRAARRFQRAERNFVLKETLLGMRDIAWCCGFIFRRSGIDLSGGSFKGLDLTEIVTSDLKEGAGFRCAVRGLVNYRFIRKLERRGVKLSRSIDWFENHPMDRGWNAAVNQYYGAEVSYGYQGFFPALAAARPTESEYEAGVVPSVVFMIGSAFAADTCEFYEQLPIAPGPAFRYASLHTISNETSDADRAAILVALPYYEDAVRNICRIVVELSRARADLTFYVKTHPAVPMDIPGEILDGYPNVSFISAPLPQYYPRVSAVICGGESTASVESMACGTPVLLIGERGALHRVTLPIAAPEHLWRVCIDAKQVLNALDDVVDTEDKRRASATSCNDHFFAPVDEETVQRFLGLPLAS